jgi:hypothetical protein
MALIMALALNLDPWNLPAAADVVEPAATLTTLREDFQFTEGPAVTARALQEIAPEATTIPPLARPTDACPATRQ